MSSIRLSPKHGVNACVPLCFFCRKEKNEVAMLGRLSGDAEAPRNAVLDKEPCDTCLEGMNKGITFLESDETKGLTGRFFVMKEEAAIRILGEGHEIIKIRKALVLPELFSEMIKEL